MRRASVFVLALLSPLVSSLAAQQRGATPAPATPPPNPFRFQMMGPAEGGRISAITGVPGDARVWYLGAASGGVWKSVDSGATFRPVSDSMPVQAIGALAVAPSKPSTVWAGTGEAWAIRDADLQGDGVYKSTDSGTTWTNMGLRETGRIGRIIVHPTNPDVVYVCALGRATGPQEEHGVYRTKDGGKTWKLVLTLGGNFGCSGLALDAKNPQVLFAGMWHVILHTYAMYSGTDDPKAGIYVTRDGGDSWKQVLDAGLPKPPIGKIDVAVAPTNSKRVYALIQTADQGSVWRSDDGGVKWKVVNYQRPLIGRAGYYINIKVSSGNADEILIANSSFFRSMDGGKSFTEVPWGGDNHDIWIDPKNPDHFALTNDGGLMITTVHGRGFHRVSLPIGQMYHVTVDNQVPYYVYSNMQDDGNMRGPSLSEGGYGYGGPQEVGWDHGMGGCESGWTVPDVTDPNIVWATCYGDEVTRWDAKTKMARSVSPWLHTLDSPPNDTKYRCHWTPPLAIDPFDHNTVYYGCQVIFKTVNAGQSWTIASPDLSTHDPSRIVPSGGLEGDNLGQFYGEVVFAIAPSQIQKGLIWAGTNDGQVWYTKDGGGQWTNVTKNISGLPAWGTVTSIQPSHFDAGTAYISVDFHLMDNRDPFIYKTTDFGQSWTKISDGLPKGELAYVRVIAEDPNCKGLLFAGTGNALHYSLDDGAHWTMFDKGLPHSTVSWAVVQKQFHDLVVSTYGRGLYILDDITPLEEMAKNKSDEQVRLFEPRATYRFVRGGGAAITYALKTEVKANAESKEADKKDATDDMAQAGSESADKTKGPVQIDVLDSNGKVVRKLKAPGKAGMNRVEWDLHYEPPKLVALRTAAPDNPHIWDEVRFRDKDSRPITHWGLDPAEVGPIVAPGKYTVKLTVNGKSYTQPLTILRDPNVPSSDAEIESSVKTLLRIRDDITTTSDMVNQIEWMRKQLGDVESMLKDEKTKGDLLKSVKEMDEKLQGVEFKLIARVEANSDDKYFVSAYKVYLNLLWLNGEVGSGAGDVAGGAAFPPTDTALSLLQMIEKDLASAKADYQNLISKDIPAFNRSLAEHGVIPVTAVGPAPDAGAGGNR